MGRVGPALHPGFFGSDPAIVLHKGASTILTSACRALFEKKGPRVRSTAILHALSRFECKEIAFVLREVTMFLFMGTHGMFFFR